MRPIVLWTAAIILAAATLGSCSSSAPPPVTSAQTQATSEFVAQLRPVLAAYLDWKRDFLRLLTVAQSLKPDDAVARLDEIAARAAATERALLALAPPSDPDAQVTHAQWLAAVRVNEQVLALYQESFVAGRGLRVDEGRLQPLVARATAAEEQANAALTMLKGRYKLKP